MKNQKVGLLVAGYAGFAFASSNGKVILRCHMIDKAPTLPSPMRFRLPLLADGRIPARKEKTHYL